MEEYGPGNQVAVTLRETIVGFLMTLAISWSKTSFAITLLRIMQGKMRTFLWAIIISMNVLMTIGALSLFLQCSPVAKSWDEAIPGVCVHEFNMVAGMFSSAYSALMDFVLALLPVSESLKSLCATLPSSFVRDGLFIGYLCHFHGYI